VTTRQRADRAADAKLVRRFNEGDEQAFVELMRRHERRVYNLAYRMLGRPEDALDAAQDAFLSCYRNLGRFRGEAAFSTWLHRIAVNACYDILRRRPAVASLDAALSEPAPEPDHADRAVAGADVQRALLDIPAEFRAVLVMFEVQDMSIEEISAALRIPEGTVKSRLHRGRVALGRALTSPEPPSASKGPAERAAPPLSREPAEPTAPSKGPNP
jgi:RNA polymerase sigma-70 factor (ECF subfamily)